MPTCTHYLKNEKNRSFKQRQNWTTLGCSHCWCLSTTLLNNIVESESGVTMLNKYCWVWIRYNNMEQYCWAWIRCNNVEQYCLQLWTMWAEQHCFYQRWSTWYFFCRLLPPNERPDINLSHVFFYLILGTKNLAINHTESRQIDKDLLWIRAFFYCLGHFPGHFVRPSSQQ